MMKMAAYTTLAMCLAAPAATAATVVPESYDMLNGDQGSFPYFDSSYSGTGNKNSAYAPLTGGVGELTDGVIATQNWFVTPDPYVGWLRTNIVITFNFASILDFNSITFYFDDSNGSGGVAPPDRAAVNGLSALVPDGPSGAPASFTMDLTALAPTSVLTTQLFHDAQYPWIMLSEVKFDAIAPIPLPAGMPLLLGGLGALALIRRKSRDVRKDA